MRIIRAASFFGAIFPATAYASCAYMPDKSWYDIATALWLWPAAAIAGYEIFRLSRPFVHLYKRALICWGLVLPYLLFVTYALLTPVPPQLLQVFILIITAFPPLLIAAYGLSRFSKPLYDRSPRRYVAGALTLPYAIGGAYLVIHQATVPLLWTVLTCLAIYLGTIAVYAAGLKLSPKMRVAFRLVLLVAFLAIAYASRPPCCMAHPMRSVFRMSTDSYCGCICVDYPDVTLGKHEKALEEKAQSGDAAAQYELGRFYFENSYTFKDDKTGLEWWRKAAAAGNKEAQKQLASGAYGYVHKAEKKKWQDIYAAPIPP